ncbi:MAG: MmcQ/YjbR family DNA-binding protein [Dehalococcoidia bacterium]|nr:MmcQ/YjbR family DNA-binding protein [Dehalococcoidia bacterium]
MAEQLRELTRRIALALPETTESSDHNPVHSTFKVRDKTFCWFLNNHHDDGRIALVMKGIPGAQGVLVDADPARFFVPPYVGHKGWIGLRVDLPDVDWGQVEMLLTEAWRATAPKRLAVHFQSAPGASS